MSSLNCYSGSCSLLNFDNAPCLALNAQTDTSIYFSLFYPEPIDLSTGTFTFTLAHDERGDSPVSVNETLDVQADTEVIDGATVSGWRLTLLIPKTHGLGFGEYFGQIRNDIDGDLASIILKLLIQLESSIARIP